MERRPPSLAPDNVSKSLREIPLFAGVADEMLEEIAKLVTEATSRRVAESFRSVSLFEGLESEDLRRIQEHSETMVVQPGEVVFAEGDEGETFYVVLRGSVELVKKAAEENSEKLAVVRAGEAFGEMALLNEIPRSATARALEVTHLLAITRSSFQDLLGGDGVAYRMLKSLSRALWATSVRFTAKQRSTGDPRTVIRDVSRVIQRSIQPPRLPSIDRYQISASLRPHEKGTGNVSWDWFSLPDGRTALSLMRVEGEGLPAGHYLALLRSVLREVARDHSDVTTLLVRGNEAIRSTRVDGIDQRVECAVMALGDGEIEWGCAGRIAGAVVRAGGNTVDLPTGGASLGVRASPDVRTFTVPMMPGDFVLSFSAPPGRILEKAKEVVHGQRSEGPSQLLPEIHGAISDALEGGAPEAAAVLVRRAPESEAGEGEEAVRRAQRPQAATASAIGPGASVPPEGLGNGAAQGSA